MDVSEEPFLEHPGPDAQGPHDYSYEGKITVFTFPDGRSLRAREYADVPHHAFLFFEAAGPFENDDETRQAVDWLKQAGISSVQDLGGPAGTYRPIWQHSER